MQSYLVEELNKAKARIKELETEIKGRMVKEEILHKDIEHLEAENERLQSLLDRWGYPKPPGITSCSANTDQGASE